MTEVSLWSVFWYALLTAVATGFGALPFIFLKRKDPLVIGISNAIAAWLMLGASYGLVYEGISLSLQKTILGIVLGLVFVFFSHWFVEQKVDGDLKKQLVTQATQKNLKKMFLIILIMTIHSAAEGIGIGTSFWGGADFGVVMSIAIAIHNIPEWLAISSILVPRGVSWRKSALWSIFTSLPQPIFAIPAYLFVSYFTGVLPAGLGFAAWAMFWLVFADIIPDAHKHMQNVWVGVIITLALAGMLAFQTLIG